VSGEPFYNLSPFDFRRLLDDSEHLAANLQKYVAGFSKGTVEVLDNL